MSNYQYKGRGLYQTTGNNNMSSNSQTAKMIGQLTSASISTGSGVLGNSISLGNGIKISPQTAMSPAYAQSYGHTNDWLKNINGVSNHYDKYEVIDSKEDLLALSATAHRLREQGDREYHRLLENVIFENVTSADREYANEMRDYYSKKIMMWKLKSNRELSEFRTALNKLVHSNTTLYKEKELGLAFYLPLFYKYDIELDAIKSMVTTQPFTTKNKDLMERHLVLTSNLTPIKKLLRKTRRTNSFEYWFKDDELNAGVVIKIEKDNQLEHLWNHMFSTEKVLRIKGLYSRRTLDDFEYFLVTKWDLDRG